MAPTSGSPSLSRQRFKTCSFRSLRNHGECDTMGNTTGADRSKIPGDTLRIRTTPAALSLMFCGWIYGLLSLQSHNFSTLAVTSHAKETFSWRRACHHLCPCGAPKRLCHNLSCWYSGIWCHMLRRTISKQEILIRAASFAKNSQTFEVILGQQRGANANTASVK
jgi:hypothetical protein